MRYVDVLTSDNSTQKAIITKLPNNEWRCEFTFKWYDPSSEKKQFPSAVVLASKEKVYQAADMWINGKPYDEVKKLWQLRKVSEQ